MINKTRIILYTILATFGLQNLVYSQELSPKDRDEIRSKAIGLVKDFEQLLNVLATKSTSASDVQDIVNQATKEDGRYFYDANTIIEDDISSLDPDSGTPKDVTIQKYLNDWDLFYSKGYDESVSFSDFRLSDFYNTSYQYIKVFYLSQFKNKNKDFDRNYKIQKRIASIRFEKKGDQWVEWINGISFYRSKKANGTIISHEEFEETYKPFVKEKKARLITSSTIDSTLTESQINLQKRNDSLYAEAVKAQVQKSEEQIKKDTDYAKAIAKGDSLIAVKIFPGALEAYTEARSFKPFEIYPRSKVNELTRLLAGGITDPQQLFEKQMKDGEKRLLFRDIEAARQIFQLALNIFPDNQQVKDKIAFTDNVIRNKAEIKSKYTSGNFKLALKDYAKVISEDRTNPVYYLERAKCYQSMGDHKRALVDLNKSIELDHNYTEALVARALTFQKLNDIPKAIGDYATLISVEPENSDFHYRRGLLLMQTNDLDAAIVDFDKVSSLNAKDVLSVVAKSEALRKKGLFDQAIETAEKAVQINPNVSGGQFQKGLSYLYKGQDDKAATALFKASKTGLNQDQEKELDKIYADFYAKAKEMDAKNETEQAIAFIKRAITVKAKASESFYFLALQNEKLGKLNEGLQALDQSIFVRENFAPAYLKKGQLLLLQKDFVNALIPLHSARIYDKKNIDTYLALGDAFVELNKFDSAMHWYAEALSLKPNNVQALIKRGKCHFKMENNVRALMDFEHAINLDKKSAEAYFLKGKINKELKQTEKAIDDFNEALELGFSKYECAVQIGSSYSDMGKSGKAIKYFTDAIKAEPDRGEAYAKRGIAYIIEEDYKNAMADLDEALKIDTSLAKAKYRTELGFLKLRFNDLEAAEKQFNKALDFDYLDPKANYGLAVAQFSIGKKELAMRSFEQAFIPRKLDFDIIKKDPWMKPILKDSEFKRVKKMYFK